MVEIIIFQETHICLFIPFYFKHFLLLKEFKVPIIQYKHPQNSSIVTKDNQISLMREGIKAVPEAKGEIITVIEF